MAAALKAVLLALLALATTAWASGLYGAKGSSVVVLDEKNFNKLVVESPVGGGSGAWWRRRERRPDGTRGTRGGETGGWVAAPVARGVLRAVVRPLQELGARV